METRMDFTEGNTGKCFLVMFLPVMAAMFLNMAYNVVDSLWIGNLLGEQAYAALTGATPLILLLNAVAMGSTNGVAILLSQAVGAKNRKKTESVIATSLILAVVFSVLVTVLLEILLPALLTMLNTPWQIRGMAQEYLSIYLLGYLAVYLYCYFTAVLRSFGNALFQMGAMLICTVLNAVLDPFLIEWLGFKGAAAATLISQMICLAVMLCYLRKKRIVAFHIRSFDRNMVGEMIKKAVPSAFQQSIPAVSTGFLTSLVSGYGITAVAAYGIIGKLEIILFYPAMAMNMVLTNIIGQCKGAKRPDRIRDYVRYSLRLGVGLLAVLSALVVIFAGDLSGLFLKNQQTAATVFRYFQIVGLGYVLNTVTNCCLGILNGLGRPTQSMLLMVFYYMAVRMPLAYLLSSAGLGLNGIWAAVLVSHIAACLAGGICESRAVKVSASTPDSPTPQ